MDDSSGTEHSKRRLPTSRPSEPEFPPYGQPSRRQSNPVARIFLNDREVRSGWRVLVFVVLWLILISMLSALARGHLGRPGGALTREVFKGELLMLAAALAAAGILALAERRSFAEYGLPWRRALGPSFWRGVLWGFAALMAVMFLIYLFHGVRFAFSPGASKEHLVLEAGVFAAGFFIVGFSEEFLFRGYPLYTLSKGVGFWPAAILLSAAFGAVHLSNHGEDWIGAASAGLIGLFFCFTVRRTGNLWFAIGLHAMWDFSQTFLFAVPDSGITSPRHLFSVSPRGPAWLTGGTVGPEGSVLVFAVIAALFALFHLLYPNATLRTVADPQRLTPAGRNVES